MDSTLSGTHLHLLNVILTEATRFPKGQRVRILDAGCGQGEIIAYLTENLARLDPEREYELYGYEVDDFNYQKPGYFGAAADVLSQQIPEIDWKKRLSIISVTEAWPYANDHFQIIYSNQVMEHVEDQGAFLYEIKRTLVGGGFSVHIFPTKHCLMEVHMKIPLVQWIHNHDFLQNYIRFMTKIGFGNFRDHTPRPNRDEYALRHADFLLTYTNYQTTDALLRVSRKAGLRPSFRYTQEYYITKLRSKSGQKEPRRYDKKRAFIQDWLLTQVLKHVASITLFLEKRPAEIFDLSSPQSTAAPAAQPE